MRTLSLAFCIIAITISFTDAKAPYVVFNASKEVVLFSSKYGERNNLVRGTEVYENDYFILKDERFSVSIKDTRSGEIYTFEGKGEKVYPIDIVSSQQFSLFKKFISFLTYQADESGFNTKPVYTSQCVGIKGDVKESDINLSNNLAAQVKHAIKDSTYFQDVYVFKTYSPDNESYFYTVQNADTTNYAFVVFTLNRFNEVNNHSQIIVQESGQFRSDNIAFIPLSGHSSLDLNYFIMSTLEDDVRTCYVIVFKPDVLFEQQNDGKYKYVHDWEHISNELIYQGDVCKVIYIE